MPSRLMSKGGKTTDEAGHQAARNSMMETEMLTFLEEVKKAVVFLATEDLMILLQQGEAYLNMEEKKMMMTTQT